MKKYFLLATTALTLTTSNVMAVSGEDVGHGSSATTVNVQVSAEVKAAATFETNGVMNFGTMYVDVANVSAGTKLASFSAPFHFSKEGVVVHHEGNTVFPTVTVNTGDTTGVTPVFKNITDETLSLGDGLEVRNLAIIEFGGDGGAGGAMPQSLDSTVSYTINGDLYAKQANFTGTGSGTLTIGYDYE